ncbi:MAG: mandelate racemase/muconate lactonizing enzyme family protein [Planctomycetaceae bacterium]
MKITDVKTVLLTGPCTNDPWVTAIRQRRSAAFIEIHTDTELIGIGETYTGYHAPDIVPAIVEFFKPILVGLGDDEIDPRELWRRMYHCANFWARLGVGVNVIAGIEGALWDLRGKMEQKPVHELLGPRQADKLLCYATGSVSTYPWSELLRKIDTYREAGFRATKVATGWFEPNEKKSFWGDSPQAWIDLECEKIETVRQHTGDGFSLALDAHMSNDGSLYGDAWNADTAIKVLKSLEKYNLVFFEEPLHYNDIEGYSQLCAATSVPVAGGECLTTLEEFAQYAKLEALDIAQPDASYIGITPFIETAKMFAKQGRKVATHAWSSGAGVMENIHAAFACPNIAILEIPPLAGPLHTEIYADGYRFDDGYILPPQAPGLGVRLTDEIKEKFPFVPNSNEWNVVPGGKGAPV